MTPPMVSVFAVVVMIAAVLLPRVTAPVPKFNAWVPTKVKLLFSWTALFVPIVTAAPLVLSSAPPLMTSVLVPRDDVAVLASVPFVSESVPALSVVVPL